jgi:hypothetical protein
MDDLRRIDHPFAAGWFVAGLYLFGIGVAVSTGTIALSVLPQMKALGAITLLCAVFGALVCAMGIRLYHPARWRALQGHLSSLGESLRGATDAIGEPRTVAYARASGPLRAGAGPRVVWPQGSQAD